MMVDTLCAIKKAMENVSVENDEWYEEGEGEGERLLTMAFLFTTSLAAAGSPGRQAGRLEGRTSPPSRPTRQTLNELNTEATKSE